MRSLIQLKTFVNLVTAVLLLLLSEHISCSPQNRTVTETAPATEAPPPQMNMQWLLAGSRSWEALSALNALTLIVNAFLIIFIKCVYVKKNMEFTSDNINHVNSPLQPNTRRSQSRHALSESLKHIETML